MKFSGSFKESISLQNTDYINYLWYRSTCLLIKPDSPVCVCLFTSLYFRDINMTKPAFRETSSKKKYDSILSKSFICPHLHAWGFWLSLQPSVLLSDERNTSILSGVHCIMHTSLKNRMWQNAGCGVWKRLECMFNSVSAVQLPKKDTGNLHLYKSDEILNQKRC